MHKREAEMGIWGRVQKEGKEVITQRFGLEEEERGKKKKNQERGQKLCKPLEGKKKNRLSHLLWWR